MKRLVPTLYDELHPYLAVIYPKLVIACAYSGGKYIAEDVMEYIKINHMQIWLAFDEDELDGFILTQVIDYPRAKALRFLCLTGVRIEGWQAFMEVIDDWIPFTQQVEDWGKSIGCKRSEIECPATWEIYMRNYAYKRGHVLLDKELK